MLTGDRRGVMVAICVALLIAGCGSSAPTASSEQPTSKTAASTAPMTVSAPPAASQGAAATPGAMWTTYHAPTGTTLGGVWVGPDGTVYTSPTSTSLPNALLALGPDGRPKRGWPVALPDYY